jgi:hypothetical protein
MLARAGSPELELGSPRREEAGRRGRRRRCVDEWEADEASVREQVLRHALEGLSSELFRHWVDEVVGR